MLWHPFPQPKLLRSFLVDSAFQCTLVVPFNLPEHRITFFFLRNPSVCGAAIHHFACLKSSITPQTSKVRQVSDSFEICHRGTPPTHDDSCKLTTPRSKKTLNRYVLSVDALGPAALFSVFHGVSVAARYPCHRPACLDWCLATVSGCR